MAQQHRDDTPTPETARGPQEGLSTRVRGLGRTAWALLGIVGVAAVAGYAVTRVPLAVVTVILALFPATALSPLSRWLKRKGWPPALAALAAILAAILVIGGVIGGMVPLVIRGIPALTESASRGLAQLESFLEDGVLGVEGSLSGLVERARESMPEAGQLAQEGMTAAMAALETAAGVLLVIVFLFFYLKDGPLLFDRLSGLAPRNVRPRIRGVAERTWETLGAYFRGQLLIALTDAVLIGIGLLIVGVPLALPLAVLIFFGGLFPIVGAVTTGALAVLVAFADGGVGTALIVLTIVLVVQQIEGNVLQPLIMSHAIKLHPMVVLLSITVGATLLGVLGAFLAVPVVGTVARAVAYWRGEDAKSDAEERPKDEDPSAARPREPIGANRPTEAFE